MQTASYLWLRKQNKQNDAHTTRHFILFKKKSLPYFKSISKMIYQPLDRVIARKDEDHRWKNIQFVQEEVIRTSLVSTISV